MTKSKLFSKTVSPICDITIGKEKGNYTYVYDHITPETVPLQSCQGEKKVYLVPLTETVEGIEGVTAYLKAFGLKPCQNAPQYLLGLMACTEQSELPNLSWIVAAEDAAASVFRDDGDDRCFLLVFRSGGGRKLRLVLLDGRWDADRDWVFLAEDLGHPDKPLESSGSLPLDRAIEVVKENGLVVYKPVWIAIR